MTNYCPMCETALMPGAKSCSCGWKAKGTTHDGRCAYSHDGQRCPRVGTIGDNPTGGPMYCRKHYKPEEAPRNKNTGMRHLSEILKTLRGV